jgi:hypothetical protein
MLSSLSSSITNARQSIAQVLNFALVLSTAFMMWKGLSVVSASSSPIVVVLSGKQSYFTTVWAQLTFPLYRINGARVSAW